MTIRWIEVLLAPQYAVTSAGRGKSQAASVGAAHLLQGRFIEYMDLASKNKWPALGISVPLPSQDSASDLGLLSTLAEHLSGSVTVADRYLKIAADRAARSDIRTAAAVLGAVTLSDAGKSSDAVTYLNQQQAMAKTDVERALLMLHLGLRHAELGQMSVAAEVTRSVIELTKRSSGRNRYARALLIVAEHNWWHFQAASGILSPRTLPERTQSSLLARIDSLVAAGLEVQLDRQFVGSFRDPYSFSMSFRSEDSTDVRLAGALLGAECFADWGQLRTIRKLRGRYLLLVTVGLAERQPDAAFHLLRRAGDKEGLERGLQLFMRVGPLWPLRRVGDSTADAEWLASEDSCNMTLLEQTAQVMSLRASTAALERLLRQLTTGTPGPSGPAELVDAVGAIVPVVQRPLQERTANVLREVAEATSDGLVLMSLARNVRAFDWPELAPSTRRAWVDFVAANLDKNSLRRNTAVAAALGLRQSEPRLREVIRAAYDRQPSLQLGALAHAVDSELGPATMTAMTLSAARFLKEMRDEAKEGRHAIGYEVDAASLLATLILQTKSPEASDDLADFLLDELVAPIHKVSAFEQLASNASSIPETLSRRLVENLPRLQFTETLFIQRESVVGSAFRLLLALRGQSEDQALGVLLSLATGVDAVSRIEAAKSIAYAIATVSPSVLASLALTLSHDPHHDVRAAAARILPQLLAESPDTLRLLIQQRIQSLLADQGVAVPRAALDGLLTITRQGRPIEDETSAMVRRLSQDHLAWIVRFTAQRVLSD